MDLCIFDRSSITELFSFYHEVVKSFLGHDHLTLSQTTNFELLLFQTGILNLMKMAESSPEW